MSHAATRSRYVLKRLLQAVPVVLAIIVVNFFLLQLAEGDAVDVLAGEAGSATPEYMEQLREKFGLDQPLPVQLGVYMKNMLTFDLGYSFRHDMPVSQLVLDRLVPSCWRLALALCWALLQRPTLIHGVTTSLVFLH